MIDRICQHCGKSFKARNNQVGKYCSRSCSSKWRQSHNQGIPPGHGNPQSLQHRKGEESPNWVEPLRFKCDYCQNEFKQKPYEMKRRQFTKHNNHTFCSLACYRLWNKEFASSSHSPFYVGGAMTYRGRDWKRIAEQIRIRDGYKCRVCHKKRRNIPVHHIHPFRDFKSADEANKPLNLACACSNCHPLIEQNILPIQPNLV